MISRMDHIAIAVKDHEGALRFFRDVLGALPGACTEVTERQFFWQTLALGDLTRIEILSPSGPDSFLNGFLRNREGGFHHITLQTPSLDAMIKRLDEYGVPWFGRNEYPGGVWKEVFIHPRDAFGALVQIAEFQAGDWMVPEAKMPEGKRWEINQHEQMFTVTMAHPGGGKVALEFTEEELRAFVSAINNVLPETSS